MAEVSIINGYTIKDATARKYIKDVKDGVEIVPKAQAAVTASNAIQANDYNTTSGGIKSKFDSVDSAITGANNSAATANNIAAQAYSLAQGRARAAAFATVAEMTNALKAAGKSDYKIGDNLFIKETNVPDYWVSGVLDTNTGTYGYFVIDPLETQKVDLTEYAKTAKLEDGTIKPKNATNADVAKGYTDITGAPSDVTIAEKFKTTKSEIDGVNKEITKIKDGTTTVGKAKNYDTTAGNIKIAIEGLEVGVKNANRAWTFSTVDEFKEEMTIVNANMALNHYTIHSYIRVGDLVFINTNDIPAFRVTSITNSQKPFEVPTDWTVDSFDFGKFTFEKIKVGKMRQGYNSTTEALTISFG